MNAQTQKKLNYLRPGSSVRDCNQGNHDLKMLNEKRAKTSRLPKRTYSLEGKENTLVRIRSASRNQKSSTSMIPRLEKKKVSATRNASRADTSTSEELEVTKKKEKVKSPEPEEVGRDRKLCLTKESPSQTIINMNPIETKLSEDFNHFKQNILKIPEFWSDADQTVKYILKNAVGIVTKQYPTADVEAFEVEIQNILKATEAVKREILTKTEDIVSQANKIYGEGGELGRPTHEELKLIASKMEELRNNVNAKNNVFSDLLKCGPDFNQLEETMEGAEKSQKTKLTAEKKDSTIDEIKRSDVKGKTKKLGNKKSKSQFENIAGDMIQSCGDILKQDAKAVIRLINDSVEETPKQASHEDKSCQTMSIWATDVVEREESIRNLNEQIMQLHDLCKDHITKFKSFNFQIKLRGMCNKSQSVVPSRDVQRSGKSKFSFYNKDLDYGLNGSRRDVDHNHKNRLMSQQKKLIHVRNELLEMLKSRCNVEVEEI